MTTAFRVLLVCLLCTLMCNAATATEVSLNTAEDDDLLKRTAAAKEAGEKAVSAQKTVLEKASGLLKSLETAQEDAKKGESEKAKLAFDAVNETLAKAKEINNAAQGVGAAVKLAEEKMKGVAQKAGELAAGAADTADIKQKRSALKNEAETAAALWKTAQERATSQLSLTDKIKEMVEKTKNEIEAALTAKPVNQEANDALEKLKKSLEAMVSEPNNLTALAQAVETAVSSASEVSAAVAKAVSDLVTAAEEAAKEKEEVSEAQQNPFGGAENPPKNDESGTTETETTTSDKLNEDSSSDGSPLTVSRLAATSVLLLLARVVVVMISA